jgi:hypothetical protein
MNEEIVVLSNSEFGQFFGLPANAIIDHIFKFDGDEGIIFMLNLLIENVTRDSEKEHEGGELDFHFYYVNSIFKEVTTHILKLDNANIYDYVYKKYIHPESLVKNFDSLMDEIKAAGAKSCEKCLNDIVNN